MAAQIVSMSQQSFAEIFVSDPLSKVTRTERRVLLGVSAIGIAIVKTGLVPSKIAALGIEFEQADKRALLRIIGFVVLYFLVAFALYAASDYFAWRYRYTTAGMRDYNGKESNYTSVLARQVSARIVVLVRLLFEFVLPLIIGVYAIVLLWTTRTQ